MRNIVRHVELGESAFDGFGAIHVDLNSRLIEQLVHTQVHRAGHIPQLAQQPGGERMISDHIGAGHLNVDGRWQSEIENLADYIGGEEVKLAPETRAAAVHEFHERIRCWDDGRASK